MPGLLLAILVVKLLGAFLSVFESVFKFSLGLRHLSLEFIVTPILEEPSHSLRGGHRFAGLCDD